MLEQVVPGPEVWDQEWKFFFSFGYNLGVCSDIEFFFNVSNLLQPKGLTKIEW